MKLIDSVVERDQIGKFLDVYVPLDISHLGATDAGKAAIRQELEELPPIEERSSLSDRQTKIKQELGQSEIYKLIPEREPGLRITRAVITEVEEDYLILAPFIITEEMCAGHMPGFPILPLAEAGRTLAQVGAVLVAYIVKNLEGREGHFTPLVYKVGEITSGQKGFLSPKDKVCLVAQAHKVRGPIYLVQAHGYLGNEHIFSMPKIHYFITQDSRLWGQEVEHGKGA